MASDANSSQDKNGSPGINVFLERIINKVADSSWKTMEKVGKYSPTRVSFIDYMASMSNTCGDQHFEWLECADRVGLMNSAEKCTKLFEDYKECKYRRKTKQRRDIMDQVRVRRPTGRPPTE